MQAAVKQNADFQIPFLLDGEGIARGIRAGQVVVNLEAGGAPQTADMKKRDDLGMVDGQLLTGA